MNSKKITTFSKLVSSVFYIGYFPLRGGGSWAALFCLIYFILLRYLLVDFFDFSENLFLIINLIILILYLPLGMITINRSISNVVFDEWVGMYIPIVILEYNLFAFILAFFIFRFFDIFKPYPINKFEDLPKAYGVLGDDIVAGVFTLIFVVIIESFIELPVI